MKHGTFAVVLSQGSLNKTGSNDADQQGLTLNEHSTFGFVLNKYSTDVLIFNERCCFPKDSCGIANGESLSICGNRSFYTPNKTYHALHANCHNRYTHRTLRGEVCCMLQSRPPIYAPNSRLLRVPFHRANGAAHATSEPHET